MNNLVVSQDSRFLAYTIDTTGEELYNLYIKDLNSGQVEVIQRNVYSFAFGLSHRSHRDIYYSAANSLMRTNRIYRHVLGTSVTHDTLVFEEPSAILYCDVKRTNDCVWQLMECHVEIHAVSLCVEVRFGDLSSRGALSFSRSFSQTSRTRGVIEWIVSNK